MRLLQTVIAQLADNTTQTIDIAAAGARAADIMWRQVTAPGTGFLTVDDTLFDGTQTRTSRIATWAPQTPDANCADHILTWLMGDTLKLASFNTGNLETIVSLYDALERPPTAGYQAMYSAATIAASATFTQPNTSAGRAATFQLLASGNRAFTVFIDAFINNAATAFTVSTTPQAAVGGGVVTGLITLPSSTYRLRLRNDDAVNTLAYVVHLRAIY